jgi:hypothetical protein
MRIYTHPKLIIDIKETNGIKYFKLIWKGIFNTVVFRDLVHKSLKSYEEELPKFNNITDKVLIVSDSREMELIRKEDIDWTMKEINPLLEKIGITHQALILPYVQEMSDLGHHYANDNTNEKRIVNSFKNEEEALNWFLSCAQDQS